MNINKHNIIIFTDMDGTLLDHHNYSFTPALDALSWIKNEEIPLILVSSKTSDEIIFWQNKLEINAPFIVENGSAIFLPQGYFKNKTTFHIHTEHKMQYLKIGEHFEALETEFSSLSKKFPIKGFYQMTEDEIVNQTGLTYAQAMMASNREFSIPFIVNNENKRNVIDRIKQLTGKKNIDITEGGRFFHFLGKTNKGKAVTILHKLFEDQLNGQQIQSVALGDAPNDFHMLTAVNHPILVEKYGGGHWNIGPVANLHKARGTGPNGWQWAIDNIVKKLGEKNG